MHSMRKFALSFPQISSQSVLVSTIASSCHSLNLSSSSQAQMLQSHCCCPQKIATVDEAKALHGLSITFDSAFLLDRDRVFLHNKIMSKYAYSGETPMARKLFDNMCVRNGVSYNIMISCYSHDGLLKEALKLFCEMRKGDFKPSQFTFGGLLSCDCLDMLSGEVLHGLIEKSGVLYLDVCAGTALLTMYARNGFSDKAIAVFETMPRKNLVTCNAVLSVFAQMGFLQDCVFMLSHIMSSFGVSEVTFVNIISTVDKHDLQIGYQIHGLVKKMGFDGMASVSNCLINMYGKEGDASLAEKMFDDTPFKDIVSWNTLIGVLACNGMPNKALELFLDMCANGLSPNETTIGSVLKSCSRMQTSCTGECIHAMIIKKKLDLEVYTGSALINFYASFDKVEEVQACFDAITHKSLVSWNSLIAGYSNRDSSFSLKLIQEMIHSGFYPNEYSFPVVIKSSTETELLQLHPLAIKTGYNTNAYVSSSLMVSYARNNLVSDALNLLSCSQYELSIVSSNILAWIYNRTGQFEKTQELYAGMENPDTVSWNILIAACSRNGDYKETFELFQHMLRSEIPPDNYTFVSLFSVCTRLCNLSLGSCLHGLILKTCFNLCDTFVYNMIIDMYGKCGSINSCRKIFNETKDKNIISWTALVSALGLHGRANEALETFKEMETSGLKPDRVSFLAVLSACRHNGLVEEGMNLFNQIKPQYGMEPDINHYVVVVDLLARYGHIKEAEKLILGMPFAPNALIWRSFLNGCKQRSSHAHRLTQL